jgi:hypothetical protein
VSLQLPKCNSSYMLYACMKNVPGCLCCCTSHFRVKNSSNTHEGIHDSFLQQHTSVFLGSVAIGILACFHHLCPSLAIDFHIVAMYTTSSKQARKKGSRMLPKAKISSPKATQCCSCFQCAHTKNDQQPTATHVPALTNCWGAMDGLKVRLEKAGNSQIQNIFFNGWTHDH